MGKWYNKIFVGNPNKEDFTAKDLPKTRMEQYFDVIKLRFGGMVTANVVFALFAIPLLLWTMYFWFMLNNANTETALNLIADPGLWEFYLFVNIPLYTIMGPALAGLYYCLRNWMWNQRATVGEHFWKEFKRSLWRALALNFINSGLFYAGFFWLHRFYLSMETYPVLKWVSVTIAVLLVLYYMSSIYQFPQLVTYDLKVIQIIKNSFIYLIVQFPRTLVAVLVYGLALALCIWLGQILLVVAMSLGVAFVALANMILSDFIFDKYVNKPENRRKGMAPINED